MIILALMAALLMSYVGVSPDLHFAERIAKAAEIVDQKLRQDVLIIIAIESTFDPKATSSKEARGLMQLTPIAVQHVIQEELCGLVEAPADIYNIEDNIKIGACYYAHLMLRFKDRDEALAYYNGGTPAVNALREGKPFKETIHYLKRFQELEAKLNAAQ